MSAIAELKVFSSSQISQSAVVPASVGSKPQFDCLIGHHCAIVSLTPDGAKIRGWDFKQLETATAFAEPRLAGLQPDRDLVARRTCQRASPNSAGKLERRMAAD